MESNKTTPELTKLNRKEDTFDLQSVKDYHSESPMEEPFYNEIVNRLTQYDHEQKKLLDLSEDITKARDKNDLLKLLCSGVRESFYFTHAAITLIDEKTETYSPFLLDTVSSWVQTHKEYEILKDKHFPLNEPFINHVILLGDPSVYLLSTLIGRPGSPLFLQVNYEFGIKEMLIVPLKKKGMAIGFLHFYSDQEGSFSLEFRAIIKGIVSQLSNAVSNVIINEKIRRREQINKFLLVLSHELVTLQDKNDLLETLNSALRKWMTFSHSVMIITDPSGKTYHAFLTDSHSRKGDLEEYLNAITAPNSVEDEVYEVASHSYYPVVFDMEFMKLKSPPLWYRLNYEAGQREMVVKILPNGGAVKLGLILFSDSPGNFSEDAMAIIQGISSQLSSVAMNLMASEAIANREREKSFLLDFSNEIAALKTKEELTISVEAVLKNLSPYKAYVIRTINDDQTTLSGYIWDRNVFFKDDPEFKRIARSKIPIKDGIQDRIINHQAPILINLDQEIEKEGAPQYIHFWKKKGFISMAGAPLRIGSTDLGILWIESDEINIELLNGISSQISTAILNILSNEQILEYKQRLEVENDQLQEQIKTIYNFSEIVGSGAEMQKVYELMNIVSPSNTTVIILGETGTGKELIARAIHNSSSRKSKIMVKVNCAAMPSHLIESELFGHEKGAFTGASEHRIGKFELAHEGTIFLDEIGELPIDLQVKLLRVIQEREFERVGGTHTIKVDVRIITATNRDLEAEVNNGRFRSDLYYRLNVFPITLPPLRSRPEDIEPLANFFLERYSKRTGIKVNSISTIAMTRLKEYTWPGNIRELEHLIERSVLLAEYSVLNTIQLPGIDDGGTPADAEGTAIATLEDAERSHIISILNSCGGKISGKGGAAEVLKIPASTLHSKIKKIGINKTLYSTE